MEKKTMRELIAEKSWKVKGLKEKLNITDKEVEEWAKLKKPYTKSRKPSEKY